MPNPLPGPPVPNITYLSWNIQKLGNNTGAANLPPTQTQIIRFIALTVQYANADVVAVMEVVCGLGAQIMAWLCAELNNMPGMVGTWRGRVSSRQDGGTTEEYIVAWREQAGTLVLDDAALPGSTTLSGVVDDQVLEPLFTAMGWNTPAQREQFYYALADSGYIVKGWFGAGRARTETATWRMSQQKWGELSAAMPGAAVVFDPAGTQPPAPLTPAQLQDLATRLVEVDILRFLNYGERSPYLATFTLGAGKRLTMAVYHALGTSDPTRFNAINVLAMSLPLQAAARDANLLLMGDFNVKATEYGKVCVVYTRTTQAGATAFGPRIPRVATTVFAPITGAPLNCANLLPTQKTSLMEGYYPEEVDVDNLLANAYDKFFFHGAGPGPQEVTAPPAATVVNLLQVITRGQPGYDVDLARSAMIFFRALGGAQRIADAYCGAEKMVDALHAEVSILYGKYNRAANAASTPGADGGPPPAKSPARTRQGQALSELLSAEQDLEAAERSLDSLQPIQSFLESGATECVGVGTALAVYRWAISDHLPIAVTLTA
ncbi:MAG TPA: hypothetical protein VHG28_14930 [Longimicrobiaceae bacterium]|nr:hypothetical protein [Longimicrobiaceae bacterium]